MCTLCSPAHARLPLVESGDCTGPFWIKLALVSQNERVRTNERPALEGRSVSVTVPLSTSTNTNTKQEGDGSEAPPPGADENCKQSGLDCRRK